MPVSGLGRPASSESSSSRRRLAANSRGGLQPGQPAVAEPDGAPQRRRRGPADPQRRHRHRRPEPDRVAARGAGPVRERLAGEQAGQPGEELIGSPGPVRAAEAGGQVLRIATAAEGHAELQAAARDVLQGGDLPDSPRQRPQRRHVDRVPDRDAAGDRGRHGEAKAAVQHGKLASGQPVTHPHAVKAGLLREPGQARDVRQRRSGHDRFRKRDPDADRHCTYPSGSWPVHHARQVRHSRRLRAGRPPFDN